MWICFNDAFISVVASDLPDELMVRARNGEHLKNLFPDAKVIITPHNDYRFRIFVKKETFAAMVVDRIGEINYTNFKNSVKENRLHDLYLQFWLLHERYQNWKRKGKNKGYAGFMDFAERVEQVGSITDEYLEGIQKKAKK
jgi:hypothetical protein